ncbi:hypothetical protein PNK_0021 [Candidatus Protochlamydia naegleriophila]|uniref:Uncharacterized protein n=1 Tax=Candidatus Protochlamydia naegleriophila TaxID=389348 RepID=A0A0U5CM32_9BACT|nr:hypothetical protein [Candidatus Protochlamydia naegleriophila]CUI15660.1 hypothetical protein PNK_0021 [Candidatus Protochlamydia naegleriophila]
MIQTIHPVIIENFLQLNEVPRLHPFFEKIIDKQVHEIALNIFEKIVDYVCRYCYGAYYKRLGSLEGFVDQLPQRIHRFGDGAPLYDLTETGRAEIEAKRMVNLITSETYLIEMIKLDQTDVHFDPDLDVSAFFGREHNTEYMLVKDHPQDRHLVTIIEKEMDGKEREWTVNCEDRLDKINPFDNRPAGQYLLADPHFDDPMPVIDFF